MSAEKAMRLLDEHFPRLSDAAVTIAGHGVALGVVGTIAAGWTAIGVAAGFPMWWFNYANMIGTLVTVLILLLMQHSQNRDMQALQIKVDELIRSSDAGNHLIGLHELEEEDAAAVVRHAQPQA
jgi:low affinity Fe/Cu permease